MSTLALNGARVSSGSLAIAKFGAWVADVTLAQPDDVDPAVTLTMGDLELSGTIFRTAAFSGSRTARVVGGKAGWRKVIKKRGYSHDAGVMASTLLQDAARESGETISVAADRTVGTSWAREEGKAEETLHLLTGGEWWIDPSGVTQTKPRDGSPIGTPFTAAAWQGGKGYFEIATEFYSDWQPGRTFNAPTIGRVQTISMVRFDAGNDGKLRLLVLTEDSEQDRMMASIRNVIRSELAALTYCAPWEYTVAPSIGTGLVSTLDLLSTDPRMPDLTNVPLAPGLVESPPLAGAKCRVRFVNADPARAEVFSLGSTTEHVMTTEACALLIYNTLALWLVAAGGGPLLGVVLQPLLLPAIIGALTAQAAPAPPGEIAQAIAAPAMAAAMVSGTAPSQTSLPFSAIISLLSTKTLDVSGYFPSVGIPHGSE